MLCGQQAIDKIFSILNETFFGHNYYKVPLLLCEALFMNTILTNIEATSNISNTDIKNLERKDEEFILRQLSGQQNSSRAAASLTLGVILISYVIMKRRLLFLH